MITRRRTPNRRGPRFRTIAAGVDEVNVASVHVLEKLGFRQVATHPGSFGNALLMLLEVSDAGSKNTPA